jgi:hypothetical protein
MHAAETSNAEHPLCNFVFVLEELQIQVSKTDSPDLNWECGMSRLTCISRVCAFENENFLTALDRKMNLSVGEISIVSPSVRRIGLCSLPMRILFHMIQFSESTSRKT